LFCQVLSWINPIITNTKQVLQTKQYHTVKKLLSLIITLYVLTSASVSAQCPTYTCQQLNNLSLGLDMSPNDCLTRWPANCTSMPAMPPANRIGKWVATQVVSWNSTSFKPYIYNSMQFRVMFPRDYATEPATKTYPLFVFLHGLGERGDVRDNERQLIHIAQGAQSAVNNKTFDGFLFFAQNTHALGDNDLSTVQRILAVIDVMVAQYRVDPNRVVVSGLSGGGGSTFYMYLRNPKVFAGAVPMAASTSDYSFIPNSRHLPVWNFTGGLDGNPSPGYAFGTANQMAAQNANFRLTMYEDLGHGVWNRAFSEPDMWPFLNRANKTNPWIVGGKALYCPGETISTTMGVTPGFDAYEWRRDGVVISGATGNELTVNQPGTYDVRIRRGASNWSYFSPIPVVVAFRTPTPAQTITADGSLILPTPGGRTSVSLSAPAGFASYQWSNGATTRTITVSQAGSYTVSVVEPGGCSGLPSQPVVVRTGAAGPNAPLAPTNLVASTISETQVQLNWTDNATNETAYEVYASTSPNAGYNYLGALAPGTTTFQHTGLNDNTVYYYRLRAINADGGSGVATASAKTVEDVVAPGIPQNLRFAAVSRTSMTISWDVATDFVGVTQYEIFRNDELLSTSTTNSFTSNGLVPFRMYRFKVRARDAAGNTSGFSNQVSAVAANSGLNYKYYHGTFTNLGQLVSAVPFKTGTSADFSLAPRERNDNIGFEWTGTISIPTAGTYTFFTESDDGSALWINNTQVVANDFDQGMTERSGTIALQPGSHSIMVRFRQGGGGFGLNVRWSGPGISKQLIPNSALADNVTLPTPPAMPTGVAAQALSHKQVQVSWVDNSSNEDGFEIRRATSPTGTFSVVGLVGANVTQFIDAGLAPNTRYYYRVRSVGATGESAFERKGLNYEYYEFASTPPALPGATNPPFFGATQPVRRGNTPTFSLGGGVRDRNTNIALVYRGYINLPVSGAYNFWLSTDDGSRVYLNSSSLHNEDFVNGNARTNRNASRTISVAGEYPIDLFYRNGSTATSNLVLEYQGPSGSGIARQAIPVGVLRGLDANATTQPLPASVPNAPTDLTAQNITSNSLTLSWTDGVGGLNEERFDILRSLTPSNYVKVGSVGTNVTTFMDSGLAGATTYYYQVVGVNDAGASDSLGGNFTTTNTPPVVKPMPNHTAPYGEIYPIAVSATDADGNAISLAVNNLPSFATFVDNGNGKGQITVIAAASDEGVYPNIELVATDNLGAVSTPVAFTLTVNNTQMPQLTGLAPVNIAEGVEQVLNLAANDPDSPGSPISFTVDSLPSFATFTTGAGNTATLNILPRFSDAGTYNIYVTITDDDGSIVTGIVPVVVADVDPNKTVFVNFLSTSGPAAAAPWFNARSGANQGATFGNIPDESNQPSGVSITVGAGFGGTWNAGATTGDNSGIVPDNVLREYYWFGAYGAGETASLNVTGLSKLKTYKFSFMGSSVFPSLGDNGSTVYSIGSNSVTLRTQGNTSQLGVIDNLLAPNGSLTVNIAKAPGAPAGYINGMIVESYVNNDLPGAPGNLTAVVVPNVGVQLTWSDNSDNEGGFEVYRSTTRNGVYTLLNPSPANVNAVTYLDETVLGTTYYFYKIRAVNINGASDYSNTVSVVLPNFNPKITGANDLVTPNDRQVTLNIAALDNPADTIKITIANAPSFTSFTDNGNGTASLIINPSLDLVGTFGNIVVTATDNKGGVSTKTFSINITDSRVRSVYVNFNNGFNQTGPWNNFNQLPFPNASISGLTDELDSLTTIGVRLIDGWQGANDGIDPRYLGVTFGDNSGIIPDNAMRMYYFEGSSNSRQIRVTGLNTAKRYNFLFVSSFGGGGNYTTNFTIDGVTAGINATGNYNRWVRINGITPDASGEATITVAKGASSSFAILNAMIIQIYDPEPAPNTPTRLAAIPSGRTSIRLSWEDNANNETGYEVYNATSPSGPFNLLQTLSANATTFHHTGLLSNTRHYYRVRAVNGGDVSSFSNTVTAVTLTQVVQINFNHMSQNNLAAPWNNVNSTPNTGTIPRVALSNMRNDQNVTSGINLVLNTVWDGANPFGATTGNNSGAVPDGAMITFYYLELGTTAQIAITGLNNTRRYNFVFFNSTTFGSGNGNTNYTINGKTVALNPQNNTSNTIQMNDVAPVSGQVVITIVAAPTVVYGYLNALIVHEYDPATGIIPLGNRSEELAGEQSPEQLFDATLKAYPNPFANEMNVVFNLAEAEEVQISLTDALGRVVHSQEDLGKAGFNAWQIDNAKSLSNGVYFLKISTKQFGQRVIKLIKE
jgi:large repetitive protein